MRNVGSWFGSEETQLLTIAGADIAQVMVSHEPSLERAVTPTGEPVASVKVRPPGMRPRVGRFHGERSAPSTCARATTRPRAVDRQVWDGTGTRSEV